MLIHIQNRIIFLRLYHLGWIFTRVDELACFRCAVCVETFEISHGLVALLLGFLRALALSTIESSYCFVAFFIIIGPQLWAWHFIKAGVACVYRHC